MGQGGGTKRTPSLKSVTCLTIIKFGAVIPYLKKIEEIN